MFSCPLILVGCVSDGSVASVRSAHDGANRRARGWDAKRPTYHLVRRGETLYSIAWRYGGDYHELAGWNGIRPPYTIYAGQRLRLVPPRRIRPTALRSRPQAAQVERVPQRPSAPTAKRAHADKTSIGTPSSAPSKVLSSEQRGLAWRWPTQGRVIENFSGADSTRKGVDIVGRSGQEIRAAAPGRVVYSGSGLVGYGKLIIIKHNKTYLSAYGHNRKLLVTEGELVRLGQQIAEMGNSADHAAVLHFEIRRNGKPVDPLQLLPKL
jgi:lipoprotein NlpD